MSHYTANQIQVGKHYLYLYNLNQNKCQSCKFNAQLFYFFDKQKEYNKQKDYNDLHIQG